MICSAFEWSLSLAHEILGLKRKAILAAYKTQARMRYFRFLAFQTLEFELKFNI